jgi:hypothetical protein
MFQSQIYKIKVDITHPGINDILTNRKLQHQKRNLKKKMTKQKKIKRNILELFQILLQIASCGIILCVNGRKKKYIYIYIYRRLGFNLNNKILNATSLLLFYFFLKSNKM